MLIVGMSKLMIVFLNLELILIGLRPSPTTNGLTTNADGTYVRYVHTT